MPPRALGVFQPQPTEAAIDGLDSLRHGERKSDLGAHKIILPTEPTTDGRTGFVNGGNLRRFVHFLLVRAIEIVSANTTLSPPDSPKEDYRSSCKYQLSNAPSNFRMGSNASF